MSTWVYVAALLAMYWVGRYDQKSRTSSNSEVTKEDNVYQFLVDIKPGMYYAFDLVTDEFLGQHEDIEKLTTDVVAKKRPGYSYYIAVSKNEPV